MSGHTPAPWAWDREDPRVLWGNVPREFGYPQEFDGQSVDHLHLIKRLANPSDAHLIEAAPDLLRELERLVRALEPTERDGSWNVPGMATLNDARAAIAAAKGEAS